ncbi:hypothetical protein QTP88_019013 [Uroleucon formosanum]
MTNLLQIHMNCCRKYRLDTDGLYLSIILLFSSILCNSMISSYKTAFFRLSFTVAADVYEHIFAARCTAQHECDGEGKCLAACALYNDIGQGISSCGPLLRARHPPPSVRTIMRPRGGSHPLRVPHCFQNGGRVRDFIDWSYGAQPFRVVSVSEFERSLGLYINDSNIVVVKTRRLFRCSNNTIIKYLSIQVQNYRSIIEVCEYYYIILLEYADVKDDRPISPARVLRSCRVAAGPASDGLSGPVWRGRRDYDDVTRLDDACGYHGPRPTEKNCIPKTRRTKQARVRAGDSPTAYAPQWLYRNVCNQFYADRITANIRSAAGSSLAIVRQSVRPPVTLPALVHPHPPQPTITVTTVVRHALCHSLSVVRVVVVSFSGALCLSPSRELRKNSRKPCRVFPSPVTRQNPFALRGRRPCTDPPSSHHARPATLSVHRSSPDHRNPSYSSLSRPAPPRYSLPPGNDDDDVAAAAVFRHEEREKRLYFWVMTSSMFYSCRLRFFFFISITYATAADRVSIVYYSSALIEAGFKGKSAACANLFRSTENRKSLVESFCPTYRLQNALAPYGHLLSSSSSLSLSS